MSPLTLGFAILWAFLLSQTTCCYCPPVFKFDVPSSMQSLNLFFPSPAFWNIFQYLMFKKSLDFWRICLFLLNKKKYNIWGVWKQIEILVTDTVLVLSLQTRIQNIFLFFLDVFFRAIHSIYGYGKYLKIFLPNTELVCKSYHHLPESQYLKQHLFFFVCVQWIFKRFVSRY